METLVEARDISKSFRGARALDRFSLRAAAGSVVGLVGPDGAGKTTAMRIMSTVSLPDSGFLFIAGADAISDYRKARARLGYMSQKFGLYGDMTARENLRFFADLHGVARAETNFRIAELLEACGLLEAADRPAGTFSGGMKQKLALCCALIHKPSVLILDEPTNGVDPVSRREFWRILRRFAADGTAIVYSTSYLDEAERCDYVNLMSAGKVIAEGTPSELKRLPDTEVVEISGLETRRLLKNFPDGFGKPWSFGVSVHLYVPAGSDYAAHLKRILGPGVEVKIAEPVLEDVFTFYASRGSSL